MPLVKCLCHVFGCYRYAYQKVLRKYINALKHPMPDLEKLCQLTPYLLVKSMRLKSAGVLVLNRGAGSYVVRSAEGDAHHLAGTSIKQDNPLFLALLKRKKELLLRNTNDEALAAQMRNLKGELFIPVISAAKDFPEPTLLGVVFLGPMLSRDNFIGKDIGFLLSLIKEARANLDAAFVREEMREKREVG